MTDKQWEALLAVVEGKSTDKKALGFIIDSPWLPGWAGISTLDYYSSDDIWLKTNLKAINLFPDIIFLPGFWSEYGMCTEPSAFGARSVWYESNLPHAGRVIHSDEDIDRLPQPNVTSDGLLPFMIAAVPVWNYKYQNVRLEKRGGDLARGRRGEFNNH